MWLWLWAVFSSALRGQRRPPGQGPPATPEGANGRVVRRPVPGAVQPSASRACGHHHHLIISILFRESRH